MLVDVACSGTGRGNTTSAAPGTVSAQGPAVALGPLDDGKAMAGLRAYRMTDKRQLDSAATVKSSRRTLKGGEA